MQAGPADIVPGPERRIPPLVLTTPATAMVSIVVSVLQAWPTQRWS